MDLIHRMISDHSSRPQECQVKLVAERRMFLKRRWRGFAEDGTEFGFDLESRLNHGAVIHQTKAADYVIWQQSEVVYDIPTTSAEYAALVGWKIGNLHFPVQILPDSIRAMHDPAVRQLLEREGWPFTESSVIFNPLRVVPHAS